MIALNNGDKLQGICDADSVVDFVMSGVVGETVKQVANGQLASTLSDLYTATDSVVISSIILVNTDTVDRTINLYVLPSGGTARRIIPKDLVLKTGFSLHFNGTRIVVIDARGREFTLEGATTSDHSLLSNLDYANSGHTGFIGGVNPQLTGDLDTNNKHIGPILQTNAIENQSKLLQTEDIFADFVVSGLLPATSSNLTSDISAGKAYVSGVRVVKAVTSHTYTASKDTYIDLDSQGNYYFVEVNNGDAEPAVTADSIRIAKVVTDASSITTVLPVDKNIFMGYQSGYNNNWGRYNIGLGYDALKSNTSGTNNVAIGVFSLINNTTGGLNVGIGSEALLSNTEGTRNMAVGRDALMSNTTASHNTGIGYYALGYITTGGLNVGIGSSAGLSTFDGSTPQTPSESVLIGYYTKFKSNGDTNEIVIGANAVGLGSNTVILGNDDIVLTRLKGNIGVNTGSEFGSGQGIIGIANATTIPSSNPIGGGVLYVEAGALKWRNPSGDITSTDDILKNNYSATAAPTVDDDSGSGYTVGSRWIDTTNDDDYVCLDASAGAAVWKKTTP